VRNPAEEESISYGLFNNRFREWLDGLDLGGNVAHQARHTLATKLLAAGASLAHIRKYLGHVSDRMAEHYAKVSHSDLDDLLSAAWVAGPGSASPGELLSGNAAPISRQEAMTLALDLSRRSTPAEGGFCTWQPVVDGGACPWNLDCANCDKWSAICSALGMAGQIAYHLMAKAGLARAPWAITTVVSCPPVLVLGMRLLLLHHVAEP